jgi:nucleoside-diphosphate-sugar epimerase
VNGEGGSGAAYTSGDAPHPRDPYGQSKWQAEQRLAAIAAAGSMESVIVRPPLVYGPGVRANFLRLMSWVDRQWPIPLGSVRNERSLVSVWNLCDLLLRALEHADAAGHTWMVSDGRDLSTPDLIRHIGAAMNKRARLWPVPVTVLRAGAALSGRGAEVERLCGSLTVDIAPTRRCLQWSPPMSVEEGLALTARWYYGRDGARDR